MTDFVTLLNRIGRQFVTPAERRDALLALHRRRNELAEPIDVEAVVARIEKDCAA